MCVRVCIVCIAVMCVSKPDITKAEKLMRVAGVFLTQCWISVENLR